MASVQHDGVPKLALILLVKVLKVLLLCVGGRSLYCCQLLHHHRHGRSCSMMPWCCCYHRAHLPLWLSTQQGNVNGGRGLCANASVSVCLAAVPCSDSHIVGGEREVSRMVFVAIEN